MYQEQIVTRRSVRRIRAVARLVIGFTFLWAFVDKLLGLGFATPAERAWVNGGTPAQGFIGGIEGPFAGLFAMFANPFGDALFTAGLLGIGVAVMAGAGLRIAAVTGTLLMAFMYLAQLPAALGGTNPIVDSHCTRPCSSSSPPPPFPETPGESARLGPALSATACSADTNPRPQGEAPQ